LSTKAFEYGDFESTSEYRFDLMLLGPAQHIPEIALGPSVNSMRTRQIEKLGEEVLLAGAALPGTHTNSIQGSRGNDHASGRSASACLGRRA
jgi:hypothetical protein